MIIEKFKGWLGEYDYLADLIIFVLVVLAAVLIFWIAKKIIIKAAHKLVTKTKVTFDDYIYNSKVFERLSMLVPVLIIYNSKFLLPEWAEIIEIACGILIAIVVSRTLVALTTGLNNYYSTLEVAKSRAIKGYVQVLNLIIYLIAGIFIVGLLTGKTPWNLLAGLGALTAVLLLIFRDTILSFVASLQIASNDLIHIGDWIEMPKYGADGDIIDIALHSVKVQNWDKTITFIPTHKLIEDSFKNWRGMTSSGGRRVKRSLHVDLNSIMFCSDSMLNRFGKISLISDYIRAKIAELAEYNTESAIRNASVINQRRLTNIGVFRKYVETYIKQHPRVHKSMTCMVRQLQPGPTGLPLEVYLFVDETAWVQYEAIQADIFDHVLAMVSEFDLHLYQQQSGHDLTRVEMVKPSGSSG